MHRLSELSDSDDDECDAPADPSASSQDSDDDDDGPPARQFSFPHLDAEIRAVIQRYDGAVFPKLNWSSPQVRPVARAPKSLPRLTRSFAPTQDAAWMIPGQSLKCQTPADVYLLLKSSDFISHDLDHAFDDCVDHPPAPGPAASASSAPPPDLDDEALGRVTLSSPSPSPSSSTDAAPSPEPAPSSTRPPRPYTFELVLKKWFDMPGSQQWRCFVRDHRLLGASPSPSPPRRPSVR